MLALLMIQLQSFSRLALVFVTAPLGLIGATGALLLSDRPFGFVALLGLIALAGMIMRNTVILVDQIDRDIAAGHGRYRAIIDATVRRARPVALTALAAILGMIPLAGSIFWGPMAITIMGGLFVATVLTLMVVPALYALWFRVRRTSPTERRSSRKRWQSTTIWNRSGSPRSDRGPHREGVPMSSQYREPRLEEMLADPIIKAVMGADGVNSRALEAELRQTAALLHAARRTLIPPASAQSDLRGKRGIT